MLNEVVSLYYGSGSIARVFYLYKPAVGAAAAPLLMRMCISKGGVSFHTVLSALCIWVV